MLDKRMLPYQGYNVTPSQIIQISVKFSHIKHPSYLGGNWSGIKPARRPTLTKSTKCLTDDMSETFQAEEQLNPYLSSTRTSEYRLNPKRNNAVHSVNTNTLTMVLKTGAQPPVKSYHAFIPTRTLQVSNGDKIILTYIL